jgi:hypothetical protein
MKHTKRFKKPFRSTHSTLGTPQNPEAVKHAISNEEYQRLRSREREQQDRDRAKESDRDRQTAHERDRAEADQIIIQTLQDAARERGLKIPADLVAVVPSSPADPASTQDSESAAEITLAVRARNSKRSHQRRTLPANSKSETPHERHARKCAVCHHPDRELIDQDFLHWHSAGTICDDYQLHDTRVVYRHAHATGIYSLRLKNVRMAAAHIVDQAECTNPTAGQVLHAIRVVTRIDDEGRWVEPPVEVIVSSGSHRTQRETQDPRDARPANAVRIDNQPALEPAPITSREREAQAVPSSAPSISNRSARRLELPETYTKQTTPPSSNRHKLTHNPTLKSPNKINAHAPVDAQNTAPNPPPQ